MEESMRLEAVGASYEGKPALQDVSLTIPSRRITAIIGPSGCGKSTLLRCMNGLLSEEPGARVTGEIFLGARPISALPREELRRRVGLVFQTPSPFPFSIYRNMTYAPRYYGVRDKRKLEAIAVEKLQMAGLYDEVREDLGKSALKLSGGQQQRLCIARALAVEPEVLLMDEPTSALDPISTSKIEDLAMELKSDYTIVIVTHNMQQAARISDKTAFFLLGELVEFGPTESVFSMPQDKRTEDYITGRFG